MTKYRIVEKDIEREIGFIYNKDYDNTEEAGEYIKRLKKQMGEYYTYIIAEVEDE